ncbi:MAG: hypothetical protein HFJ58_05650 [Clostridia bacterium]|nr:hypothetical protein [Clostridia bacterium]
MMQATEYVIKRGIYGMTMSYSESTKEWYISYMTKRFPLSLLYDCICEVFAELSEDICETIKYNFADCGNVRHDIVFKRGETELDFYKKISKYCDASS